MQSTSRASNTLHGYVDSVKLSDAFAAGLINPFGDSGPVGNAAAGLDRNLRCRAQGAWHDPSADFRASRDLAHWSDGIVTLGLGAEARAEALDDLVNVTSRRGGCSRPLAAGRSRRKRCMPNWCFRSCRNWTPRLRCAPTTTVISERTPARRSRCAGSLRRRGCQGVGRHGISCPFVAGTLRRSNQDLTPLEDPQRCPVTMLASDCNFEVPVLLGGNPALRPETSRQASSASCSSRSPMLGQRRLVAHEPAATIGTWTRSGPQRRRPIRRQEHRSRAGRSGFPDLPGRSPASSDHEISARQTASGFDVDLRYAARQVRYGQFRVGLNASYLADRRASFDGDTEVGLVGKYDGGVEPALAAHVDAGLGPSPGRHAGADRRAGTPTKTSTPRAVRAAQGRALPDRGTLRSATPESAI